jgi:hypothetical protein
MTMRELPGGSIVPAAQGVDAFLRPMARNQRGGLPQLRALSSGPPQIQAQAAGSGGNVEGFNQWAQLAGALAPFNDALSKVALTGVELYASGEYEKGRNDAVRAQVLANQQRLKAGAEYAAQNRAVDAADPIAGQLMDRVNPFRQAGRENQLARLAAGEAGRTILDAYRQTPEANTWAPNDPRLAQIKVDATSRLLKKYGLNETSAGFQDYVNPEIAQAWDRVSSEQYDAFTAFQKDTVAPTVGAEILQIYNNAREQGGIAWTEFDPTTGKPVQRQAALGDPGFNQGMRVALNQAIDRIRDTMGLRGETTETTKKTINYLLEMLNGRMTGEADPQKAAELQELIGIVGQLEVGPPGKDGKRLPAVLMFGPDFYRAQEEGEKDRYEKQGRQEASLQKQFENELALVMSENPEASDEQRAAVEEVIAKWGERGLGYAQMLEATDKFGRVVGSIAERQTDQTGIEEFMAVLETMDPAGFDSAEAMQALKARLAGMPNDMQADYLKRFSGLAASKGKEAQNSKRGIIDPILSQGIAAALRREYPKTITEASLRGVKDIQGWMAFGDANVRTAAARLNEGARKHMQARMDEAAAKAGRRLSNTELTAIATTAFNEYLGTKDQDLRQFLFPGGLSGGPGIEGGKVQSPQPQATGAPAPPPPPGRQWSRTPTVTSGNLDNVDPKVLESGAVVLEKPSAMREVMRVLGGQAPSAAVQRAARAAGMTPAKWLLRQIDGYPGAIDPAARKLLLDRVNKGAAAGQKISRAMTPSPFVKAGSWLADLLLGVRPAMAASGGGQRPSLPFSQSQVG